MAEYRGTMRVYMLTWKNHTFFYAARRPADVIQVHEARYGGTENLIPDILPASHILTVHWESMIPENRLLPNARVLVQGTIFSITATCAEWVERLEGLGVVLLRPTTPVEGVRVIKDSLWIEPKPWLKDA